jgi:hypothetical protein
MDTPTAPASRSSFPTRIAILLAVLAGLAWQQRPDGQLHVYFLAVGGDAMLIQSPAGRLVLIDGGSDPAALTTALGRRMPFWRRDLDGVVLTQADTARLPGQVAALERYSARFALAAPASRRTATVREWQRLLQQHHTRVLIAQPGQQINLDGAILQVVDAEDGVLLRLNYGATSVVFAHTLGEGATTVPAALQRPATLVVFPWEYDPRTPLTAELQPQAIIFTDGQHAERPAQLTFRERAIGGAALYHERLHGGIEWVSDGRAWRIVTEQLL